QLLDRAGQLGLVRVEVVQRVHRVDVVLNKHYGAAPLAVCGRASLLHPVRPVWPYGLFIGSAEESFNTKGVDKSTPFGLADSPRNGEAADTSVSYSSNDSRMP